MHPPKSHDFGYLVAGALVNCPPSLAAMPVPFSLEVVPKRLLDLIAPKRRFRLLPATVRGVIVGEAKRAFRGCFRFESIAIVSQQPQGRAEIACQDALHVVLGRLNNWRPRRGFNVHGWGASFP